MNWADWDTLIREAIAEHAANDIAFALEMGELCRALDLGAL